MSDKGLEIIVMTVGSLMIGIPLGLYMNMGSVMGGIFCGGIYLICSSSVRREK